MFEVRANARAIRSFNHAPAHVGLHVALQLKKHVGCRKKLIFMGGEVPKNHPSHYPSAPETRWKSDNVGFHAWFEFPKSRPLPNFRRARPQPRTSSLSPVITSAAAGPHICVMLSSFVEFDPLVFGVCSKKQHVFFGVACLFAGFLREAKKATTYCYASFFGRCDCFQKGRKVGLNPGPLP